MDTTRQEKKHKLKEYLYHQFLITPTSCLQNFIVTFWLFTGVKFSHFLSYPLVQRRYEPEKKWPVLLWLLVLCDLPPTSGEEAGKAGEHYSLDQCCPPQGCHFSSNPNLSTRALLKINSPCKNFISTMAAECRLCWERALFPSAGSCFWEEVAVLLSQDGCL